MRNGANSLMLKPEMLMLFLLVGSARLGPKRKTRVRICSRDLLHDSLGRKDG